MKAIVVALVLTLLLSGCGGLLREAKPTVRLALEPSLPAGGVRAGGPSLEVETFATAAAYCSDQISLREGPSRWSFTTRYRWVADPGEMVASAARGYLSGTGMFGAVFMPPGPVEADYHLSGAVRSLYWDRENRTAVLEIEASLVAHPATLRGFWIYRKDAPVAGETVTDFLRAASSALERALADLNRDLGGAVGGAP
jgi:ABC-type uncharacterized transport system auxiliary subunit